MAQNSKGSFTRALTELIGPVATQALIDAFPGQPLYIPHAPIPPDHPIAAAIGLGPAQTLSQHYGGCRPLIPLGYDSRIRRRNVAILAAHQSGASTPALAQQFGLSNRQIRSILSRFRRGHVPVTPQRWTNFSETTGYPPCASCPFLAKTQATPNDRIRDSAAAVGE